MEQIEFPRDFKEFLRLLHDHEVESIRVISFADLKINKRASGRPKDLADLDHLP
jgi:hypothetical protein